MLYCLTESTDEGVLTPIKRPKDINTERSDQKPANAKVEDHWSIAKRGSLKQKRFGPESKLGNS